MAQRRSGAIHAGYRRNACIPEGPQDLRPRAPFRSDNYSRRLQEATVPSLT